MAIHDEQGQEVNLEFWDIGRRIKSERERIGLTQQELAEQFGVAKNSVYFYERGDRTPSAARLKVLHGLGADSQYILTGERARRFTVKAFVRDAIPVLKDLDEMGIWQKLNWEERGSLLARMMESLRSDQDPADEEPG